MLTQCFTHLQGIGPATENTLRAAGICCWDDALGAGTLPKVRGVGAAFLDGLRESADRLKDGDALWFSKRLSAADQWRLYPHFYESAAFVDIETTGLSWPEGQITTIALYDGKNLKTYAHGHNLEAFADDIEDYTLLVTWNGRGFDAPFLRRAMNIPLDMAHLDLLPVYRGLGLKGGLKKVEKALGIDRGELDGVDGYMAVLLWREYMRGNENALETLLAYNAADVLSLEFMARHACEWHGLPLETGAVIPDNPHSIDRPLVERLLRRMETRMFWR